MLCTWIMHKEKIHKWKIKCYMHLHSKWQWQNMNKSLSSSDPSLSCWNLTDCTYVMYMNNAQRKNSQMKNKMLHAFTLKILNKNDSDNWK